MRQLGLIFFASLFFQNVFSQVNLSQGLVLHLPFNGNSNDVSGNGNNGIITGATLTNSQNGSVNSAYSFNGISDFIQIANSASLNFPNDSFTLYALVKPTGFYSGSCHGNIILDKGSNDNIPGWYELGFSDVFSSTFTNCNSPLNTSQQTFSSLRYNATSSGGVNFNQYLSLNNWYCVIAISDGLTINTYVNGTLVLSRNIGGPLGANSDILTIGKKNNATYPYWFKGIMDEIRIYNRAINVQEINALCNCGGLTINATASQDSICDGQSTTLTSTGATSYSWTGGVTNGVAFTPIATNTYTVTGTDASGCSATSTVTITINPLPNVQAFANPNNVCIGNSTFLTGGGASTYTWSGGKQNGVPFFPSATVIYTVTGTDANGCSNTSTTQVNLFQKPIISSSATSNTICLGQSTIINGAGGVSYTITGGITNGVAFYPSTTSTYVVTGWGAGGCSNTSSQTITVNQPPTISISGNTSVCAGKSTTLTATGGVSYSWSGGIQNGVSFTPSATTIYTVTATGSNSCTTTSVVTVTVNPLPNVQANASPNSICIGNSTTLTGVGANSYIWNGSYLNGVPFMPNVTSNYTVTGTDINGCSNSSSIQIVVFPKPNISAQASQNPLCAGNSTSLSGLGGISYTWSGGISNNVPFTLYNTSTYTVTGVDINNCSNTNTYTVVVNNLPAISISGNSTICESSTAMLTASGASIYTWTGGIQNGVVFYPTATNTYTVTGVDINGCSATNSQTIQIVNSSPISITNSAPLLCVNDISTLTASGANSYNWSPSSGLNTNSATTVLANPSSSITYTVTGTDANGCTSTSTTFVEIIQPINISATKSNDIECGKNSSQLMATGATNYFWTPAALVSNPNSNITPTSINQTTTFYVTGTTGTCVDTDSITVEFYNSDGGNTFIPSAFTPNNDGKNDCLHVKSSAHFLEYYFAIFNKWGQRVYETSNSTDCWNGFYNGQEVTSGSYFYYLKATTSCGEFFKKGDITLIR